MLRPSANDLNCEPRLQVTFRRAECGSARDQVGRHINLNGVMTILLIAAVSALTQASGLAVSAETDGPERTDKVRHSQPELGRPDGEPERKLLADLAAARIAYADHGDPQRYDKELAAAFRGYGLDLDQVDLKEAGARLAGRQSTPEIAAAIDEWCRIRRTKPKVNTWRRLRSGC